MRNGFTEAVRTGLILAALGWNLLATIQLKEKVAALTAQVELIENGKASPPR